MLYKNNETVKVDLAHAELVKSLITCHKPKNILEFGYGGGRVTDKILEAISYNQNSPSYSVVDNWLDVGGIIPDGLLEEYKGRAEIITSNEEDFVKNCDIKFDFIFSCPPYADLEVYSDLKGDISNMPYIEFMKSYEEIIEKSCNLLKSGGYACFVVGEVRDKKGDYIGFVPDTINAFRKCGMKYYNEAILLNQIASASMRANGNMKNKKLVKIHQNVLVFKKD